MPQRAQPDELGELAGTILHSLLGTASVPAPMVRGSASYDSEYTTTHEDLHMG